MTRFKNVKIIAESEIFDGEVLIDGGKIAAVGNTVTCESDTETVDGAGRYLSPGFIDLHVHGGGGCSAMGSIEDVVKMCEAHARFGTTSILPTTLAAPVERLKSAIDNIVEAKKICKKSNILGVHLEGPFLSPDMAGAQSPENILSPAKTDYEDLLDYSSEIRMMGAAPETEGGMALGEALQKRGIIASIAHSAGDYDTAVEALKHGYTDATHLYNATTSCYKVGVFRYAGTVEAVLSHDEFTAQIISDLRHQPVGVLKLTYKAKGPDRVYLITDALEYAAMDIEEGKVLTQQNGMAIVVEDGVMKLADRSCLAGSVATCDRLVRNMYHAVGAPLTDAVKMASTTPARVIGVGDKKGKIEVGYDADIVLFDENINVSAVYVGGQVI